MNFCGQCRGCGSAVPVGVYWCDYTTCFKIVGYGFLSKQREKIRENQLNWIQNEAQKVCRKVGHAFRQIYQDGSRTRERCTMCWYERTFYKGRKMSFKQTEKTYQEGHARDYIQPNDPMFKVAYPNKKVI